MAASRSRTRAAAPPAIIRAVPSAADVLAAKERDLARAELAAARGTIEQLRAQLVEAVPPPEPIPAEAILAARRAQLVSEQDAIVDGLKAAAGDPATSRDRYGAKKQRGERVARLAEIHVELRTRIMQALSSKEALTAYDRIVTQRTAMGNDPVKWMNAVQLQLMGQLSTQTQMLTSNFATLSAAIGNSMIPDLTKIVTNLQLMTASAAQFFMQHPGAAKAAAIGLGGVAAAGAMAAIAVGGYITAGVFSHILPGLIGRLGIGHTLPHLLPAGGAMARLGGLGVTGIAGRVGASVLGVTGISKVVGLLRTIPMLATVFDHIGGAAKLLALPLVIIAKSLGFLAVQAVLLGVKIVSGIGDIVMLVQAIHFFFDHAKNIGWLLGKAARWMADNVPKILSSWGPRLFDAMKSLVGYMLGALDPRNWVGAFQNFLGGITSGFNAKTAGPPSPLPHPTKGPPRTPASASQIVPSWMGGAARGGYTTAEGLAYLHKGEVVVNHRTTRALDRLTAPGHSGSNVVNAPRITLHYNAPAGESEVVHRRRSKQMNRELAQAVAAELSRCAGLGMRSGGAIPQMADESVHAFLAGVPS